MGEEGSFVTVLEPLTVTLIQSFADSGGTGDVLFELRGHFSLDCLLKSPAKMRAASL